MPFCKTTTRAIIAQLHFDNRGKHLISLTQLERTNLMMASALNLFGLTMVDLSSEEVDCLRAMMAKVSVRYQAVRRSGNLWKKLPSFTKEIQFEVASLPHDILVKKFRRTKLYRFCTICNKKCEKYFRP